MYQGAPGALAPVLPSDADVGQCGARSIAGRWCEVGYSYSMNDLLTFSIGSRDKGELPQDESMKMAATLSDYASTETPSLLSTSDGVKQESERDAL